MLNQLSENMLFEWLYISDNHLLVTSCHLCNVALKSYLIEIKDRGVWWIWTLNFQISLSSFVIGHPFVQLADMPSLQASSTSSLWFKKKVYLKVYQQIHLFDSPILGTLMHVLTHLGRVTYVTLTHVHLMETFKA